MARYTSRNLNDIDGSIARRKKWGIALLVVSLLLFVCIITSVIYPVRSVLLGVFGLCIYPVLLVLAVISILMMQDRHYVVRAGYVLTLIGLFISLVCLFQLIFSYPESDFSSYVLNCYHAKNTAGGLVIGTIVYGINAAVGDIFAYAIVSLAIIVCVAFVIDHFLKMNEYNEILSRIVDKDVKKVGQENSILQNTKLVSKKSAKEDFKPDVAKRQTHDEDEEYDEDNFEMEEVELDDDEEESDDEEEVIEKPQKASTYKEKLAILQSKTSMAAQGNNAALNIWGQDFIDSLNKREDKSKDAPARKDYNINDLIMDKRKQDRNSFMEQDAGRPIKFVHEDDNTEELFASKIAQHDSRLNNQNNNNQFINQNRQMPQTQQPQQNRPIPNVARFNSNNNNASQNLVFDDDDDDLFEEISSDDVSNVIGPNNRANNVIPNINNMRNNRMEQNQRFNPNEQRLQSDRMQSNVVAPNRMQQNNNPQPTNRAPEQIKIRQTQPTDQPTTKYRKPSAYVKPPIELLKIESAKTSGAEEEYSEKAARLEETLEDFKIPAKVVGITHGPAVTRYELQMPAGIPVKNIARHSDDIAMKLESFHGVRIEAPIPGRNLVGVEVPNGKIATIGLKDIIGSKEFLENKAPLTFALGKDISGAIKVCDLGAMPHLLVAGSTGSGKSVCLNVFLLSLLYRLGPDDLKLILIDPKRVEFVTYNYLPHMLIPKAINESQQALNALDWAIKEMTRRYDLFSQKFVRNFKEYNSLKSVYDGVDQKLPYIVIVVDEVADLMMSNKREMEDKIKRLTQLARAAGIHLVLATQRPSVDIITGTIKSNLPSRIAFAVTNYMDSKTILDQGGAENLLGKGDMLYAPQDAGEPMRIQCPYVDGNEVYAITEFIKKNNEAEFDDALSDEVLNGDKKANQQEGDALGNNATSGPEFDPILPEALLEFIEDGGEASISLIQRRHSVGYGRAARIIDQMEKMGYVSKKEGNNRRNVLISREQYDEIFGTDE